MSVNYCKCWRTEWHYDVMADDRGVCKHCGLMIEWFLVRNTR